MSTPTPWYTAGTRLLARGRAHWRSVTLLTLVGGAVGGVTALLRAPVYRSEAAFRAQSRLETPGGTVPVGAQTNAQFLADLLTSDTVLRRVAQGAGSGGPSVDRLRQAIHVSVNLRTAIVRFSVDARTPQLARALAAGALAALTDANAALRAARASEERALIAARTAHAREQLEAAQRALRARGESQRLEADVARQVYVQMRVMEEMAAAREARNAATVGVIESPQLPVRPDRPRRGTAMLVGFLVGAAVALLRLLLEDDARTAAGRAYLSAP